MQKSDGTSLNIVLVMSTMEVVRESVVGKKNDRKDERSTWASERIISRCEHTQVQCQETEAAYAKCMAELNFQFTTDMLWKHERAIFSTVID